MKYFKIFSAALFLFTCIEATANRQILKTHEVIVKKGESYHGVFFPEGSHLNIVDQTKAVASAVLSQDFKIGHHLIKAGTNLIIWDNGMLAEITTKEGQRINNLVFAEGEARIRFNQEAKLEEINLNRPKEVEGLLFAESYQIKFHANGKISSGTLARDQEKEGLKLKAKIEVHFFESGKLKQLKLAEASQFGKFLLVGDANIANPGETEFWENGSLKAGILAKNVEIQGIICGPGPIVFFESGKLRSFVVGADRVVSLDPYPGQTPAERAVKPGDSLNMNEAGKFIGWRGKR